MITDSRTLIAVDGDYLNRALRKKAQRLQNTGKELPENCGRPRLRVDFAKLAKLLSETSTSSASHEILLNYYTDSLPPNEADQSMGRVSQYWPNRGWGFIAAPDGKSYFFHNQDVVNKRDLRLSSEDRFPHPSHPEFAKRIRSQVVSFTPTDNEGKLKAENVRLEQGAAVDKYFRLRREPFLSMLGESGYNIVRCKPSQPITKAKDKSVDCRIVLDAVRELQDSQDRFVLVSDDLVFTELLRSLHEDEIPITLVAFQSRAADELGKLADRVVILDDRLDEIQLEYEDQGETEDEQDPDKLAYAQAERDYSDSTSDVEDPY